MVPRMEYLTEDAKAILLLCGRFSIDKGVNAEKPLSLAEYNRLADWMVDRKMRPADLLASSMGRQAMDGSLQIDGRRIQYLLGRGAAMALAVEKLTNNGIWIVCRSDAAYPLRLKKHLGRQAPPVLFGVGDSGLLDQGGLSIVGSRNVDAEGEVFTRMVAQTCARDGLPVVSGGARGVDQTAMFTALEAGGKVVGVLADSLQKAALTRKYRTGIREKRLALVSPFHPDARFNVGNAMGRNKYIYALSDFALIISAEVKKGGTWAGATEELNRTSARPVYVRMAEVVPQGNRDLMDLGARSFPPPPWDKNLKNLLFQAKVTSQKNRTPLQQSLFGGDVQLVEAEMVKEEPRSYPEVTENHPPPSHPALEHHESRGLPNIYGIVRPVILRAMADWISAAELAEKLNVRKGQLEDWLKQAVKDAVIEKKSRPVRYRRK